MRSPLTHLGEQLFDVTIIGGGINGASAAQHAAAEGYSVLLIDKGDFGSGATGRSSRLLHCGLRYFETSGPLLSFLYHPLRSATALRMARQAMQARRELVKTAPERTRAMTFLVPIFEDDHHAPWHMDLAFKVLASLAPRDVPLNYERLSPSQAVKNPLISRMAKRDRLQAVAAFTEYQIDWPERLCMDAILDAERMGAVARNYTQAELSARRDELWTIRLTDQLNPHETVEVRSKTILNMAGIWIDQVLQTSEAPAPKLTFGTKGAHLVVQLPPECRDFGLVTKNSLGEPFYCIPWGETHYIGPTETPFEGDRDSVFADKHDVEFLLQETAGILPGLQIGREQILSTWAGVRPLTYDSALPKGKRSRELHDLSANGLDGILAMTGGPVMSHRSAGREISAQLKSLLQPSSPARQVSYRPYEFRDNTNSPPLLADEPAIRIAHIRDCVREQHARTLTDVLYRRTGLGWKRSFRDPEIALAAEAMASELNWTSAERDAEVLRFKNEIQDLFGVPVSREMALRRSSGTQEPKNGQVKDSRVREGEKSGRRYDEFQS